MLAIAGKMLSYTFDLSDHLFRVHYFRETGRSSSKVTVLMSSRLQSNVLWLSQHDETSSQMTLVEVISL